MCAAGDGVGFGQCCLSSVLHEVYLLTVSINLLQQQRHLIHRPGGVAKIKLQRNQMLFLKLMTDGVVPVHLGLAPLEHEVLHCLGELSATFIDAHGCLKYCLKTVGSIATCLL